MNLWFVFLLSLFLLRVQKSAGEPIFRCVRYNNEFITSKNRNIFYPIFLIPKSNDSKVKLPPEEELQVGSVLFDKSYWIDHCWTKEELIMLRSRKLFQTLLPKVGNFPSKSCQVLVTVFLFFFVSFRLRKSMSKTTILWLIYWSI